MKPRTQSATVLSIPVRPASGSVVTVAPQRAKTLNIRQKCVYSTEIDQLLPNLEKLSFILSETKIRIWQCGVLGIMFVGV